MALVIDKDILFIHIAKTGGTFFREALKKFKIPCVEICGKHSSYGEIHSRPYRTTIGFIRDPVDWYQSRWNYAKHTSFIDKVKEGNQDAARHWMASVWSDNIDRFVINTLHRYPEGIAQTYFAGMLGLPSLDYVGGSKLTVYESHNTINAVADVIEKVTGLNRYKEVFEMERVNQSPKYGRISNSLIPEIRKTEFVLMRALHFAL